MAYNETPRMPVNPGEEHLACVVVVDTSSSMKEYEKDLNDAICEMRESICEDDMARGRVDICMITFDDHAKIAVPFGPVESFHPPYVTCGGMTATHEAIALALKVAEERKKLYQEENIAYKQPWIWLKTDGGSNDKDNGSFNELVRLQNEKKCVFFGVGIGNGINETELKGMHKNGMILKVSKDDFKAAFEYLSQSVRGASVHKAGQTISLPAPPQQITVEL